MSIQLRKSHGHPLKLYSCFSSIRYSISRSGAPEGPYVTTVPPSEFESLVADARTLDDVFRIAVMRGGSRAMLGTREVFCEVQDLNPEGYPIKKVLRFHGEIIRLFVTKKRFFPIRTTQNANGMNLLFIRKRPSS